MKITILGCGTSAGVPMIGCSCTVCSSTDTRNRRRRCSILIEAQDQTIIVDTGPDFREQCLSANLTKLDAIIYTHAHADHVHGIDDVRTLNNLLDKAIPAYAHHSVFEQIVDRFHYAFGDNRGQHGFWRPQIDRNDIDGPFKIGPLTLIPFRQGHGSGQSWGLRIGNFAYSPDVDHIPEDSFEILKGTNLWIVDALRDKPHPSHAHLELTLSWIERLSPKQTYLTHMNHEVDYESWTAKLPKDVAVAHDGLILEI